jgi:hypothetical protein
VTEVLAEFGLTPGNGANRARQPLDFTEEDE